MPGQRIVPAEKEEHKPTQTCSTHHSYLAFANIASTAMGSILLCLSPVRCKCFLLCTCFLCKRFFLCKCFFLRLSPVRCNRRPGACEARKRHFDLPPNIVGLMLQREAEMAKAKCNNTAYLRQQAQMSMFALNKHICQVSALLAVTINNNSDYLSLLAVAIRNCSFCHRSC